MRVRFQVNYSIIAVDILLFVAVVDRRPAAESRSLSTLFAPRILAISRALFLAGSIPDETIAVATVISAARIRVSSSVSVGSSSNLQLHNYLIYLSIIIWYLKSNMNKHCNAWESSLVEFFSSAISRS